LAGRGCACGAETRGSFPRPNSAIAQAADGASGLSVAGSHRARPGLVDALACRPDRELRLLEIDLCRQDGQADRTCLSPLTIVNL
jgi:hypothetical protein